MRTGDAASDGASGSADSDRSPSEAWAAVRGARAALVLFTRFFAGGGPYTQVEWRWGLAWAPAIGSLLGLGLAGVWAVTVPAGPWVAATACVACGLVITGALHEDGLADTADALGGGRDPSHVLQILKDPRMGVYGTCALAVSLLARAASLATLASHAGSALILVHTLARTPPIWLIASLPYISADPRAGRVVSGRPVQVVWASLWSTAVLSIAVGWQALSVADAILVAAVVGITTWVCRRRFSARVGGINGDFLGAAEQLTECAVLITLAWCHGA